MATKWTSPVWRMPENSNQSKLDNYSLSFDGNQQVITLPSSIDLGNNSTISFWTNFTTDGVFLGEDSYGSDYIVFISGTDVYYRVGTVNQGYSYWSSVSIPAGQWHHIVFVRSGSDVEFYLNNASQGIQNPGSSFNATTKFDTIGGKPSGANDIVGSISQLSGFDYALSETQVKYLYNDNDTVNPTVANPQNPMAIAGPAPIAYYPLGESSIGSDLDPTSNPNTLTVPNESGSGDTVFDVNGSNNQIDLGDSNIWSQILVGDNRTGVATFSSWVKGPIVADGTIWDFSSNSSQRARRDGSSERLLWQFGSGIRTARFDVDKDINNNDTGISLDDDKWLHIVFVFKAGSVTNSSGVAAGNGTQDIELFLNGHQIKHTAFQNPYSSANTWGSNNANSFGINVPKQAWSKLVSNAQIWNSELTSSEITTLYNGGRPYTGTQPQAANIKGWWKLDVDTSTWNGSDWTIGNSTANYTTALNFGDRTQIKRVNVPLAAVNVTNAITVSSWIKTQKNNATRQSIISNYNATLTANKAWGLQIGAGWSSGYTKANFIIFNDTASTYFSLDQSSSQILTDNNWHNVVAVWDGTTTANAVKIFVDGLLAGQGTSTFSGPIKTALNSQPAIGEHARDVSGSYGGGNVFGGDAGEDGFISNIQVWDTALTYGSISSIGDVATGQIAELYNSGTPLTTAIASSNMKSWYKLDNLTTGIQDSSGNSNNGTNVSTSQASSFVSTLNGTSLGMNTANLVTSDLNRSLLYSSYSMDFDGTDYMETAAVPPAITQVSLSVWIKRDGAQSNYNGVLGVRNGVGNAGNGYLICWDLAFHASNNTIQFRLGDGISAYKLIQSNTAIPDDTWTHVLGVLNGTNVFMYINGVKQTDTETFTGTLLTPTVDISIGKQSGSGNSAYIFNGKISNPAVFDRGLSENEILTIYNGGAPSDISSLSPINWWSLSGDSYYDGSKWVSPDLGSNSNNTESTNLPVTALVGDAPGSTANGTGTNMNIPGNLEGNAPNSDKNAYSVNMVATNRDTSVPSIP